MVEKKLFKTKMCNLYQRGHCHRQSCSFAHGDAELRRFLYGRGDHRGDLREKLDRRRSPLRSYSPERNARGRHESYGDSPRSPGRNGKRRKSEHGDGHSDFSESLRVSEGAEDKVGDLRRSSSESKEFLDEQLGKLQSEINLLDDHKHRLENYLNERIKETSSLSTRIQDLELQLSQEKEEARRITSKIKKFVKAYNRQVRLEDELKRSRAELQRVCEQLGLDSYRLVDQEEDPGLYPSDEEIPADDLRNQNNELQISDSLSKKRPRVHTEVDELSLQAANPSKGEMIVAGKGRMEKLSRWNPVANSNNSKKAETHGNAKNASKTLVDEHTFNTAKHASSDLAMTSKSRISEPAILFPSTSMAARASDDFVEINEAEEKIEMTGTSFESDNEVVSKIPKLPFRGPLPPPPPLPIPENTYAEHKGDDENVDIDGTEEETMEEDIV